MRYTLIASAVLFALLATFARGATTVGENAFPPSYVPSGGVMFKQFCASCHGLDAHGGGPAAAALKTPPPDLTTLARRHGGKFPNDYVESVLRFGPGVTSHGSSDMPTWGPIFQYFDKRNEQAVKQRIKNLSNFLASLQEH